MPDAEAIHGPDILHEVYAAALDAMRSGGPSKLAVRIRFEADLRDAPEVAQPSALIERLDGAKIGEKLLSRLRLTLATWDADTVGAWASGSAPRTDERRQRIYRLLEIGDELRGCFDRVMPVAKDEAVIVSDRFEPWYGRVMQAREPFYWAHYADYLATRGWHEDSIAALGLNTTRVVERLADPERVNAYQAKGLVVGYVQSGKTANFTGVAAKAIDAGYRLIIVLTGTTDLLRGQTQRRLDKELVGAENLLRGIDVDDEEALEDVDYQGDPDWDEFVHHGALPSTVGSPDIFRLTTHRGDYKSLKRGIASLDFELIDPALPLNAAVNLHRAPARLAVVKKNKAVLAKFVKDLKSITARLADIPVLIIDDESDQASINTSNPKKWEEGRKERTAINKLISELLERLPRGQYVGYTATPFASVFVDAADAIDIFPRDFILSLDRPPGYMGAGDFHDLEELVDAEERTVADSNEQAFVRPVHDDDGHSALGRAIDSFVLAGAVKLWRESQGADPFRHHTMLVHESVRQVEHLDLANDIRDLWQAAGYYGTTGLGRLEQLFDEDLQPVMDARGEGEPVPERFADIKIHLGEVIRRVEGSADDPVIIVNGNKDMALEDVDFERRPVWRILVGGAKLARGFTVEGLTVSYYRRTTKQADTLMQMGRWFGYRRGFRDLVRLYIDRGKPGAVGAYDLYEAFEAACRSEELFRAELEKYAEVIDGVPQVTPAQVPPLVAQHLPWLKPSATNKMYNAQLVERRSPGAPLEPVGYPKAPADLVANAEALRPFFDAARSDARFSYPSSEQLRTYPARYGVVDHATFIEAVAQLRWLPSDHFAPDLAWLAGLAPEQISDWVVLLPQHAGAGPRSDLMGYGPLSVFRRERRRDPLFGAISDPKHRVAAGRMAGLSRSAGDEVADGLRGDRRGAVLLYPVMEVADGEAIPDELGASDFVPALVVVAPGSTGSPDRALIRFVVRDSTRVHEPIVDSC